MINTSKIKGRMAEKNVTNKELSKCVSLSEFSLRRQLRNEIPMRLETAQKIQTRLDITDLEFPEFFLI